MHWKHVRMNDSSFIELDSLLRTVRMADSSIRLLKGLCPLKDAFSLYKNQACTMLKDDFS